MDTRSKIAEGLDAVSLSTRFEDALFIVAWFDPMLSRHAATIAGLQAVGRPLVVVITDPEDPILPAPARAELAAGLGCVSGVAIGVPRDWLATLPAGRVTDLRDAERRWRRELGAHVRSRHQVAG